MPLNVRSIGIFLFLTLSATVHAQIGGIGIYKFLDLPMNARTTAVGGNSIALSDGDLGNALHNPALLNDQTNNQFLLNQVNLPGSMSYGTFAVGKSFKNFGNTSFGIHYVSYGEFEAKDEIGTTTGTFRAADYLFNLGYSAQYEKNISYGFHLKTIYSSIEQYFSVGLAADFGVNYFNPESNFSASFLVKNAGAELKSYQPNTKEELPFQVQVGISKRLSKAPFRYTLVYQNLQQFDITYTDPEEQSSEIDLATGEPIIKKTSFAEKFGRHLTFGVEALFSKNFILRVGYNHQKRAELSIADRRGLAGFSWGFEIGIKKFHLSYGNQVYGLAGAVNQFTLMFNLNDFKKSKSSSPTS